MKLSKVFIALAIVSLIGYTGCMTVQDHRENLHSTNDRETTVGTVQKEIRKGMSGAEVAEVLGSPNVVTKDEGDSETWVYDKIATEVTYSNSQNAMFLFLGGTANQSGGMAVTQKTLTVVIKFDENKKVKSFSYHSSKF
jgi:outer membrane protein assembly factor BamE (lipoprotein component of BamABCDE complex)